MREIKFRGKRISDNDWFYGDLVTDVDNDFKVTNAYIHVRLSKVDFTQDSIMSRMCLHEVDPETVGQYTGLKDKNGKEIYEGDIYEIRGEMFQIVYHQPYAQFMAAGNFEEHNLREVEEFGVNRGNIYENPELLEDNHV